MADNKGTHSPESNTRQEFPETKDKIVEIVELCVEPDYYGISIRFHDKTSLTFSIEPYVLTSPIYSQWIDGEEKILKEYQPVSSEVPIT